jgi:4-methyl-5(b-hydroxyethyl)-thiazole monophosphate biosynthesis
MGKHAIIILADGFEELEAVAPIDLLRRAGIQVTILGLHSLDVRGSHDIVTSAAMLLNDFSDPFDALILPGGPGHRHLLESGRLIEMIKSAFSRNILCAAICAAPIVLAKAGILANKKATCFPGFEDKLGGAVFVDKKSVADGNVLTSRGAGTAIEFALDIIGYLSGKTVANSVAEKIVFAMECK